MALGVLRGYSFATLGEVREVDCFGFLSED
jgi:hypothetical protein